MVAVTGTLVLWLAGTTVADAAQGRRHRHQRAQVRVCDARVGAQAAARPGRFSPVRRMIRRHVFALLQRTHVKPLADDDAAIQNGAAVGAHQHQRLLIGLEPIGLLATSHSQLFSHRTVSRRSPRGPPLAST